MLARAQCDGERAREEWTRDSARQRRRESAHTVAGRLLAGGTVLAVSSSANGSTLAEPVESAQPVAPPSSASPRKHAEATPAGPATRRRRIFIGSTTQQSTRHRDRPPHGARTDEGQAHAQARRTTRGTGTDLTRCAQEQKLEAKVSLRSVRHVQSLAEQGNTTRKERQTLKTLEVNA